MGLDKIKNIEQGNSSNTQDVASLILLLESLLPHFRSSDIFKRDIFEKSDENHYTETFIKYIENEAKDTKFSFKQQASLPKRRSVDIAIHLKTDSEFYIFVIEAKFLPTNDYVSGNYAAIKRFKKSRTWIK